MLQLLCITGGFYSVFFKKNRTEQEIFSGRLDMPWLIEVETEFVLLRRQAPQAGLSGEKIRVRFVARRREGLGEKGRVMEFSHLRRLLEQEVGQLAEKPLSETDMFQDKPPTLEHLGRFIFRKMDVMLERHGARSEKVELELPGQGRVIYREDSSDRGKGA
jgi:hypothetical protein